MLGLSWNLEVWAVPLSLNDLLAVWWHVNNPTRNQSLHSCCSNMWANMFPGDSPYYSEAIWPPGDWRARWNWGVVTTQWASNELLEDKWDATWEVWKSSHGEWRRGVKGDNHTFSSHYSFVVSLHVCLWISDTRTLWGAENTHLCSYSRRSQNYMKIT